MKFPLFNNLGFISGSKQDELKDWLETETFQQCLKKARLQRGIRQPLEEIAIQKECEAQRVTEGAPHQFKTLELGDGFVAVIDCVNRIVKIGGWTEVGMFKFELCL